MELLNALALVGTVGEVLPAYLNKSRNLNLFSSGKVLDVNSSPELVVTRFEKVGVLEFRSRETTAVVVGGSWAFTWGGEFCINDVTSYKQFMSIGYRKKE